MYSIALLYMRETKENWVTCQSSRSHHLKYHLQLKTKKNAGDGKSVMGGQQECTVNKSKIIVHI